MRLLQGRTGKPNHPPLTDAAIGFYLVATVLLVIGAIGVEAEATSIAATIVIAGGLVVAVPTALTGFLDWLTLPIGTDSRRLASLHALVMLTATGIYAGAFAAQLGAYGEDRVATLPLVLAIAGVVATVTGGYLGGRLVFGHGLRVEGTGRGRPAGGTEPAHDSSECVRKSS